MNEDVAAAHAAQEDALGGVIEEADRVARERLGPPEHQALPEMRQAGVTTVPQRATNTKWYRQEHTADDCRPDVREQSGTGLGAPETINSARGKQRSYYSARCW